MEILIFFGLVALGYFAGTAAEKKHYASITEREQTFLSLPTVNLKHPPADRQIEDSVLVTGNAVIAVDYFKVFAAGLRNLFGGRVTAYESLVDRARREATLRMQEEARRFGADMILNLRLETSNLSENSGSRRGGTPSIEALAYGTAIRYRK